ncbi:MAG: hypothetical protein IPK26_22010 [Planctomycetes bacterium]|nr:hypothetical protein [Planctomycetota bacterium]
MNLMLRLLIYVPVLFLIAIVVMGQFHDNANDTLRAAVRRTGRWIVWTTGLVVAMSVLGFLFIW